MSALLNTKLWTYGAEHEWGNIDQRKGLPKGFGWDRRDVTMVNSNGIAVDPKGISYQFGGEINTPPTSSIKLQVAALEEALAFHPNANVNYRSNLHVHIRIPGLRDNLKALKKIQRYIHENRGYLNTVEPIPKPSATELPEAFRGAERRYQRRLVSHHATLTEKRFLLQQQATNLDEFFAAEAPAGKDGKPLFHLAPRNGVNLRQLKETDTVEFRHFPGTLDSAELHAALRYVRDWLYQALTDQQDPIELFTSGGYELPQFKPYVHWRECIYRKTCHDGTIPRKQIEENIQKVLSGEWSKTNFPAMFEPEEEAKAPPSKATRAKGQVAINIRGTSGSGKSTILFNLLHSTKPTVVMSKNGKTIIGYLDKKHKLFFVGKYATPAGGCDGVKKVDFVFSRVFRALDQGYSVVFEGLLLSGLVSRFQDLQTKCALNLFVLTTPIDTCLERVKERRANRGETRPMNPKNTEDKFRSVKSSTKTLLAAKGTTLVETDNKSAYYAIGKLLGLELLKFDPHPGVYSANPPRAAATKVANKKSIF